MPAKSPRSTKARAVLGVLALLFLAAMPVSGDKGAGVTLPVGEQLSYSVSWAGIRCGAMRITSFRETDPSGAPIERIVVLLRSSKFFDGIYRVRSRLDSTYDPVLASSVRYRERSQEKKKRKDELWVVDHESSEVVRHGKDGDERIPLAEARVLDPLAFVFSLRSLGTEVEREEVFNLMTSDGVVKTTARTTAAKTFKTKAGRCDAVAVVPEPRDEMLFSKSGAMVVWVERSEPHRPCRIEFDLSFGKLVANLTSVSDGGGEDDIVSWESWGD
ncbi:MAG: DUF3108 domain-containing protein [Thermoanaerobaculales bacterium]|jgi:hypothetical protein|nr:DUF3108 domain-containing protein [Thermoanaerobaculales bacterium]